MKKTPIAIAVGAALGFATAQAEIVDMFLVGAQGDGPQGAVDKIINHDGDIATPPPNPLPIGCCGQWTYDTVTDIATQSGTDTLWTQIVAQLPGQLFKVTITDLVVGAGGAASATFYECVEGTFGPTQAGASLCGNYNYGANFLNETTTTWGPGTAFSRTIGGDDQVLGEQQNVNQNFDEMTSDAPSDPAEKGFSGEYDGITLVMSNIIEAVEGQSLILRRPFNAEDDTDFVNQDESKDIPIGANDMYWYPGATFTEETAAVSDPPGSPGTFMINNATSPENATVTFTPAAGFVGSVTWEYRLTDAVKKVYIADYQFEDTATVTVQVLDPNLPPEANDLSGVTLSTQGITPTEAFVDINVGPGGDIPGNLPGVTPSTVTTDPSPGVTSAANEFIVTITAATFTSDAETVEYTITDSNNAMATGTISLSIPDVVPETNDFVPIEDEREFYGLDDSQDPPAPRAYALETVDKAEKITVSLNITAFGNGNADDHEAVISGQTLGSVENLVIDPAGKLTFDYTPTVEDCNGDSIDVLNVALTDGDGSPLDPGPGAVKIKNEVPGELLLVKCQETVPGNETSSLAFGPLGILSMLGVPLFRLFRRRRRS